MADVMNPVILDEGKAREGKEEMRSGSSWGERGGKQRTLTKVLLLAG